MKIEMFRIIVFLFMDKKKFNIISEPNSKGNQKTLDKIISEKKLPNSEAFLSVMAGGRSG